LVDFILEEAQFGIAALFTDIDEPRLRASENYKCGDMKRYGLNYEPFAVVNQRLVSCSIFVLGKSGPYRDCAGFMAQVMGDLMSVAAERTTNVNNAAVAECLFRLD
jgi:crotonobetainyl-CoA:carnitine CoA-transferase CaiB-like acyl-CoA transferase